MTTSSHSQRSTSARRRTYSPTQTDTAMGKQSHNHHHHVFATPPPVKGKGNPFSASYNTDPSASPSSRSVPDKRKQHQTLPEHSPKRGRLHHRANLTPTKQLPFFSPARAPPSPHHKPRAVPHYVPLRYHPSSSSNVLTNAVRWDNYKS